MNKAAPRRHTSHRLPPWIVLILSLATIGMILGVDLRATHEDLTQREGERLAHAADVVGSTLSRSLQSTTVALDAIAPDLLLLLAGRDEVGDVNRRMEFMVSAMIGVRTLLLVDAGGTVLASLTSSPGGGIVLNDAGKVIEITITAEQSEAFAWTSAVYDLELVSAAGKVTALLEGAVSVSGEVTTPIT